MRNRTIDIYFPDTSDDVETMTANDIIENIRADFITTSTEYYHQGYGAPPIKYKVTLLVEEELPLDVAITNILNSKTSASYTDSILALLEERALIPKKSEETK